MSRNQALTWCSDTLHSILGCSDSALALYLTTEAAKASSYNQILSILKEGNVVPINAATESDRTRILDRFAQDLYRKCHKIDGQSSRNAKKVATRKTNADWVKSAAKYDLLEDEGDGMESKASFATSKSRTITKESTSLNEPPPQITIKKESKRSRRRRRANSSDSSDGDYEHESVRKRYEEHVEEREPVSILSCSRSVIIENALARGKGMVTDQRLPMEIMPVPIMCRMRKVHT